VTHRVRSRSSIFYQREHRFIIKQIFNTTIQVRTNRFNLYQALKRIILVAYDKMYTSQREDYLLQYAKQRAIEMLVHLKTTYGFINPTQLGDNY
jgi:hypothetical protein